MNTHRRAWTLRAGVVVALVAGSLTGLAAPAQAEEPTVQIISLSSASLNAGERASLRFAIRNNNNPGGGQDNDTATVSVRTNFGELRCEGRCEFDEQIPSLQTRQFEVALVARRPAGRAEPHGQGAHRRLDQR